MKDSFRFSLTSNQKRPNLEEQIQQLKKNTFLIDTAHNFGAAYSCFYASISEVSHA